MNFRQFSIRKLLQEFTILNVYLTTSWLHISQEIRSSTNYRFIRFVRAPRAYCVSSFVVGGIEFQHIMYSCEVSDIQMNARRSHFVLPATYRVCFSRPLRTTAKYDLENNGCADKVQCRKTLYRCRYISERYRKNLKSSYWATCPVSRKR